MNTYKEMIYMVLDELHGYSDDFSYTEDHVAFLLDKYRAFILKKEYANLKKTIPESNYQTVCLDLEEVPAMDIECSGGYYLRTKKKLPYVLSISTPIVYPIDFYQGSMMNYVSRERMMYANCNKYLKNIIYCSLNTDNKLYFTSGNAQFLHLRFVKMTALFETPIKAAELKCESDGVCDPLDAVFPLEEGLIPSVLELTIKDLAGAIYRPSDDINNANDDLDEQTKTSPSK